MNRAQLAFRKEVLGNEIVTLGKMPPPVERPAGGPLSLATRRQIGLLFTC